MNGFHRPVSKRRGDAMRSVEQYLEKATEFEAFAATSSSECMQKRFTDIAACYRLLARDRERLVATGAIPQELIGTGPSPNHPIGAIRS
jgi:hypothetical protein